MLVRTVVLFNSSKLVLPYSTVTHHVELEWVWTIVPALILCTIAGPSFALLYSLDEINDPEVTLKIIGHQWYWSYEYSDFLRGIVLQDGVPLGFDATWVQDDDLEYGSLRLLETDFRVVLPTRTHIRLLITSADVLHSWAVPSLGVKVDACPGRLNRVPLYIKRGGLFYGQCSEICGVLHGFMPIMVEAMSYADYHHWALTHGISDLGEKEAELGLFSLLIVGTIVYHYYFAT